MKNTLIATTIFCAALTIGAGAQSPLGLTYPLGAPDHAVSGASAAIGGGGTAVIDEYFGTSLNPANAAVGGRSVFSALVSFDMVNISDNGKSNSVAGYMPKYLSLIVPVGIAGNLNFSVQKLYNANLNFHTEKVDEPKQPTEWWYLNSGTTKTTAIEVYRAGGLSSWQAGWAYRFGNGVSLGLIYEYQFFTRNSRDVFESTLSYELDGGNSYAAKATDSAAASFSNNGFRFGAQIPVHEKVTLGFAGEYTLPGRDNGTETRVYRRSDDTAAIANSHSGFSVTMPPYMSIGAAYAPNEHWLFATDAYFTLWEFYENGSERHLDEHGPDRGLGVSAGARYIPAANAISSKYWEKIHYSAGIRYATLPNDKSLDRAREYALSAGAGLPIPRDGGMVDIVISLGKRSDPKYSGYGENIVKLQLGLSGGRSWFQKDASKDY